MGRNERERGRKGEGEIKVKRSAQWGNGMKKEGGKERIEWKSDINIAVLCTFEYEF